MASSKFDFKNIAKVVLVGITKFLGNLYNASI